MEIQIAPPQRDIVMRNRQRLSRLQELHDTLRVTVFTPDDLTLVKDGPSERRNYLDQILVDSQPKYQLALQQLDRVLRQRNMLLKQAGGRLTSEVTTTLEVWDLQLTDLGTQIVAARRSLIEELLPRAREAFSRLTRLREPLDLIYQPSYEGALEIALAKVRSDDLRRGVSTVGPHRDDLLITAAQLDARTRLSQGRQRAITLSLRLAAHDVVTEHSGITPILLLDDVFSELDDPTAEALFAELPTGQTLLTTAGVLPKGASTHRGVTIVEGGLM
jgi:DNA replication and repair protein RecF